MYAYNALMSNAAVNYIAHKVTNIIMSLRPEVGFEEVF